MYVFWICVYSIVTLRHVCSIDTKVLGKNVLSGKKRKLCELYTEMCL